MHTRVHLVEGTASTAPPERSVHPVCTAASCVRTRKQEAALQPSTAILRRSLSQHQNRSKLPGGDPCQHQHHHHPSPPPCNSLPFAPRRILFFSPPQHADMHPEAQAAPNSAPPPPSQLTVPRYCTRYGVPVRAPRHSRSSLELPAGWSGPPAPPAAPRPAPTVRHACTPICPRPTPARPLHEACQYAFVYHLWRKPRPPLSPLIHRTLQHLLHVAGNLPYPPVALARAFVALRGPCAAAC